MQKMYRYSQASIFEDKELGRGNYGQVVRAMCDDLPCAAKLLNPKIFRFIPNSSSEDAGVKQFNQDCKMLLTISHPCIVQYLDAYVQPESGQAILLMELMDDNLTNYLDGAFNPLPFHLQTDLCCDIVQALAYLHSNNIVHCNLTGKNVLVFAGGRAKVTDFGMKKMVNTQQMSNPHLKHMTLPASTDYMPPESFKFPPSYSYQVDIFSFGVVSLQIMTRHFPQPSSLKVSEVERRKSDINLVEPDHPILPLMLSCLKDTDILRPPAQQLCRKLRQLQTTPQYEESRLQRERALQEIDGIRRELKEMQKESEELELQLESVRLENKQLSRLITKYTESMTSNEIEKVKFNPNGVPPKPKGVPEDYLTINDPSLLEESLEEEMDLTAPNPALWYHGSISRDTACMRLQSVAKAGCYLIRRSESDPSSFVLSFVDKQIRVFNYKITCRNGQYNVSGQSKKWFSSMENLIGYYTRYSTVKQNQHLVFPVAPPEIIPLPGH